jgi:PTS system nitrogen regulatory IIA component
MSEPGCFRAGSVHSIAATDKYGAIVELIRNARALAEVQDLGRFEECVITRERISGTGLGRGVAVAHGKTPLVDRVIVTLGVSRAGIEFGAPDGQLVHLLFLVASPPDKSSEYLMALSAIARLCKGQEIKERVLGASIAEAGRYVADAFGRTLLSRCERLAGSLALSSLF